MIVFGNEFVAGTGSFIYDIFIQAAFGHEPFELSVDRSGTDGASLLLHTCADLTRSNMLTRDRLKI